MKLRLLLLAAFSLFFFFNVPAQDKPTEEIDFVSTSREEFRGRMYEYHLDNRDLKDTPDWKPGKGEPPLSIAAAVRIAENNFGLFVEDPTGWEISSLRLTSTSKHKWYYYVTVSCMKTVCLNGSARGFHLLIKLDGTVIQPKFTPVVKDDGGK